MPTRTNPVKSVVLLSGGMDSAVLLASIVNGGNAGPLCVAFDYGQRHEKELWCSFQIAHYYGATWEKVSLPRGIFEGLALTGDGGIPHARHDDPSQSATVVPNRNMVMLSVAAAMGAQRGATRVLFGAHAGDAAIYADCRHQFVGAIDRAMRLACGIAIEAPFLAKNKADIVSLGRNLMVPFDMTWSCYEGGDAPCGQCGACRERAEALA